MRWESLHPPPNVIGDSPELGSFLGSKTEPECQYLTLAPFFSKNSDPGVKETACISRTVSLEFHSTCVRDVDHE